MSKFQSLSRIISSAVQSNALHNFSWLMADRVIRLAVSLVVIGWIARYLGRIDFGLLSFAMAIVSVFATVTPLGMQALVIRELVTDKISAGKWLGTAIAVRFASSCALAILAVTLVTLLRPADPLIWWLVGVLACGMILQSLESGEAWFQSQIRMRILVIPRLCLFLIINGIKVGFIIKGAGVLMFAALTMIEQSVSGLITFVLVRRDMGRLMPFRIDTLRGRTLLSQSWPLAISALSVVLYMKLGLILVGHYSDDNALGLYAAAIKIPEAITFIPAVLASSLLPSILRSRGLGPEEYQKSLLRFFRLNVLIVFAISIPICLLAPLIIRLLFGPEFADAAPVLALYVWTLVFVFLGVARGQYLLNERMTKQSLMFTCSGLLLNVIGNILLIPRLGPTGAAIAALISYGFSAFLSSFLVSSTRLVGRLQWHALISPQLAFQRELGIKNS